MHEAQQLETETYVSIRTIRLAEHIFAQLSFETAALGNALKEKLAGNLLGFALESANSIHRQRNSYSSAYDKLRGGPVRMNNVRWSKNQIIHQQAMRGMVYMAFGNANTFKHFYLLEYKLTSLDGNEQILAASANVGFAVGIFYVALAAAAMDGSGLNCLVAAAQILYGFKVAELRLLADEIGIYASRISTSQLNPSEVKGKSAIGKEVFSDIKTRLLNEVNSWFREKLFERRQRNRKIKRFENGDDKRTALIGFARDTLSLCVPPDISEDLPDAMNATASLDEANALEKRRIARIFDQHKFAHLCEKVLSISDEKLQERLMIPDCFNRVFPPAGDNNDSSGLTENYIQRINAKISEKIKGDSDRRKKAHFRAIRIVTNKGELHEIKIEDAVKGWRTEFDEDVDCLRLEGIDEERGGAGVFLSYLALEKFQENRLDSVVEKLPEGQIFEFSVWHQPRIGDSSGQYSIRVNYTPPERDLEFFYDEQSSQTGLQLMWHPPVARLQSFADGRKSPDAENHVKRCQTCQLLVALFKEKDKVGSIGSIQGWGFNSGRKSSVVSFCATTEIEARAHLHKCFSGLNVKIDESDDNLYFIRIWSLLEEYRSAVVRVCVSAGNEKHFLDIRLTDEANRNGYFEGRAKLVIGEVPTDDDKIFVALAATSSVKSF